jgi:hypothetical protein
MKHSCNWLFSLITYSSISHNFFSIATIRCQLGELLHLLDPVKSFDQLKSLIHSNAHSYVLIMTATYAMLKSKGQWSECRHHLRQLPRNRRCEKQSEIAEWGILEYRYQAKISTTNEYFKDFFSALYFLLVDSNRLFKVHIAFCTVKNPIPALCQTS